VTKPLNLPGLEGNPECFFGPNQWGVKQGRICSFKYITQDIAVQEWNAMVRRIVRECRKGTK